MHSMNCHALLKDTLNGRYIDVNQMHLNVYGLLTPRDLIGHTIWDLDLKMNKTILVGIRNDI